MRINPIYTDKVESMQAYDVPSSNGMIKLDAMESPYTLPEDMHKALGTALAMVNINRYPNPKSTALISKVKQVFELPKACDVLLGNGSDELIQIILMATMRPGATVLSPAPSFVMYKQAAELLNMRYVGVDLNADFSLDEQRFLTAIERENPAVIFIAYPNNPTGNLLDKGFLRKICESAPGLVVLDEAYTAYADSSAMNFITEYDNVVLISTVSKIGLAGIRLGYMVGNPNLIKQFDKVRMPYNINVLTAAAARFMLDQMQYLNGNVNNVIAEKNALYNWLSLRADVRVFPSQTNFLLVRFEDSTDVFMRLRDKYKVLVKNLHGTHSTLVNILRITVGRAEENIKLREALMKILD